MKKKQFGLLMISALMAAGLASCGGNTPAGSSEGASSAGSTPTSSVDSTPVSTGKIVLDEDRPQEVAIGAYIDLDLYVTATKDGAAGTFTATTTTAETVRIDGHKVYGVARGAFTIVIQVDGTNTKKAYVGNVISENKAAMNTWLATVENNYTATLSYSSNVAAEAEYQGVWTYAIHNEDYWYNTSYGIGFLHLADNNWYGIEYDDDDNLIVNPGPQDCENYYMSMAFPFESSDFVEKQDEDGVWYHSVKTSMSGNFQKYLYRIIGVEPNEFVEAGEPAIADFDITSARAYFNEESEVLRIQLYKTTKEGEVFSGYTVSIGAVGDTEDPDIEEYIESGVIPAPIEAPELATFFEGVQTEKNATVSVQAYWNDGQGNEIDIPDTAVKNKWDTLFYAYEYETYMDDGIFYEQNLETEDVLAVSKNTNDPTDETVYMVTSTEGEWATKALTITEDKVWENLGVAITKETVESQVYSKRQEGTYQELPLVNYSVSTAKNEDNDISFEVTFADGTKETVTLNGMLYNFICLTPMAEGLSTELAYYQRAFDQELFDLDVAILADSIVQADLSLTWASGQYYDIIITISDVGDTEIPTDYLAAFETAAAEA